jgi:hypothetical protein
MMDADNRSVQARFNELDDSLISGSMPKVDAQTDTIARLIPKWSIETWILFLSSNGASDTPLGEDRPYKESRKPEQWTALIPTAAKTLFAWNGSAPTLPENLLDSLRRGLDEIPRALPFAR